MSHVGFVKERMMRHIIALALSISLFVGCAVVSDGGDTAEVSLGKAKQALVDDGNPDDPDDPGIPDDYGDPGDYGGGDVGYGGGSGTTKTCQFDGYRCQGSNFSCDPKSLLKMCVCVYYCL
jgi:hypothetical protein